jgi:plasmid stabilization system protein ParE
MSYQHIYTPVALVEYKDAVSWYDVRSKKASENFVITVREKIKSICENPSRYKNVYKYYRETSLKKYPYYIIYFVDENKQTVIISSVYHHKRNPKKKYQKS